MRRHLIAATAFAVMLPLGAAHAQALIQSQEGIALQNQILQLQQQVQQLQASGGASGSSLGNAGAPSGNGAPPNDGTLVTSLLNQVQQLQSQVQQLNGEVDTLQNQVNTQHAQTEKEIGDINFKLSNGATPGAAPGAPANPQAPNAPQALTGNLAAAPPAAAPATAASPKEVLHQGEVALCKHDYATAESAARSVLSTAPHSPQAYMAQYLLAQSLAGEHRPQDAAIAYDDVYNRDRTGTEAPQALLGLANALADINQDQAACSTLDSLNSQFPTPPAGMTDRIAAVSRKAHCG